MGPVSVGFVCVLGVAELWRGTQDRGFQKHVSFSCMLLLPSCIPVPVPTAHEFQQFSSSTSASSATSFSRQVQVHPPVDPESRLSLTRTRTHRLTPTLRPHTNRTPFGRERARLGGGQVRGQVRHTSLASDPTSPCQSGSIPTFVDDAKGMSHVSATPNVKYVNHQIDPGGWSADQPRLLDCPALWYYSTMDVHVCMFQVRTGGDGNIFGMSALFGRPDT